MLTLHARNLHMQFGERPLFYIPELIIAPGDAIWLRGANGVGKTTLLKILAGLQRPSGGELSNRPSLLLALARRFGLRQPGPGRVIYLHQSPYLFDGTVRDNLAWGLKQRHHRRLIDALRRADLEHLAAEHVSLLSGGERQRLALARAWVLQPAYLLLDEPTANLDSHSIALMADLAQDLGEQGCARVVTSHQENLLTARCQRHWLLQHSQLVENGPLTLYRMPTREDHVQHA
ncbi:ABC transporter ATP-binding protein [Aeromonas simiae]|uniref:Energy-coupling factor ABC transporter ATP-binding protein n=1 Tax=Aeromonas simiae TaxID=218936 RepID=A0A5J6WSM8_9GAMM|nr:energy-coupling factor ABC transporter ATP-binding protein [Aeromonas simiae]QFI54146.1 energy-coupling factor ABC transporter ATP-binding protein [Aeromonas simiae]